MLVVLGAKVFGNLLVRKPLLKQRKNALFPARYSEVLRQQLINVHVGDVVGCLGAFLMNTLVAFKLFRGEITALLD